jgi:hypothetical protein
MILDGGCGRRSEFRFKFIMFHVLLKREKELSLNVIQNAFKPTLKISMVSNIGVATESPRDRILNRRNIGSHIIQENLSRNLQ